MKRAIVLAAILGLALATTGCVYDLSFGADVKGSGVRASEAREVAPFNAIELVGSPDVRVTVGDPQSLVVEADDNLLAIIETKVHGKTLEIRPSESYSSRIGVDIIITVPELEAVEVTGAGNVYVDGLQADWFDVEVTGSGDVTATGTADRVDAEVTGSGDIDLIDLEAREADASVTGSGDILIHATETLRATIMGSGDIEYAGDPELRDKVMGSGDITRR